MATNGTRALGEYGERVAARYLTEQGMQVLDRNWRCEVGEIDIVALDRGCLVVCEVKTRRSLAFGAAVEAVVPAKAARLRRLAGCWREAHPGVRATDLRIDVVGVFRPRSGAAEVTHVRAVGA